MTTALGAPPATTRRPSTGLGVLVGAAVIVGWVLYRHYAMDDVLGRIARWDVVGNRIWAYTLVDALLLTVPYAVVLLLWGRDLGRAVAGAGSAVATGLVLWGIDRAFESYVWDSGITSVGSIRVYTWSELLVPALLVPLAWGLARRDGRGWLLGVLVGPVVAAVLRELQLRVAWWEDRVAGPSPHYHWQLQAVVFVAPFVLAVLACWAIESRGRRTPEMGSSA